MLPSLNKGFTLLTYLLPSLEHGFKSGGSSNCNFTFDQSVYLFHHSYFNLTIR